MLDKIRVDKSETKSKYILQFIFSHFDEKRRLQIVKYSKKYQEKLEKSLINYKIFKGKYIVYETKTKGKIYDAYNNELLYDGEISKGERNRIGKEYKYG